MLSAFPVLTVEEFDAACRALVEMAPKEGGWSMRLVTTVSLPSHASTDGVFFGPGRLIGVFLFFFFFEFNSTRQMVPASISHNASRRSRANNWPILPKRLWNMIRSAIFASRDMSTCPDSSPQEALIRDPSPSLHIDYNIQLSPTYRVPVLYFALRSTHAPLGLDAVYQYVVPEQYKKELKSVGVMGGISFGYHPDSGAPAFFVHPCNTANAMAHTADAQSVTPAIYLLIWLGLVGHCVNLHVPREFFAQDGTSPA
ncbi:hypothetical protein NUU61_008911 [Penicillium alfredii]|uniref:Ubiquitin-like-conjugating enzyme ATG10 n=1 Tax=Penicillium alfredii TaxID=1506179 RepID=A0A9W9JX62_9EURO|nr:uncharacterized protein NUU61_008911 [Penicillium alfredii]KAJ5084332.1 hypothetical protein NUU61_008911 [Penicillium alfredii]